MNLLFTITAFPPSVGGAQSHFHQLARQLVRHHQVLVATHWAETRTDWLLGTTLRLPHVPPVTPLDRIPVHQLTFTRRERLGLVPFVFGYYPFKGLAIDRISDRLVPHLEHLAQGADLIHHGRIGREGLGFASLKLARKLDVPFVLTPFHHPRWVGWNYRHYIDLYRRADAVIALTEVEKRELTRLGVEPDRVHVTGMGPVLAASPQADAFRDRFNVKGPMVLFLGQKYRYKGCATLLQAAPAVWSSFPGTTFVFIGPPTRYSTSLFDKVRDGRVLEIGVVDLETKSNALAACDLLCLPSTQESFGAVFLEAWMLGKPVIGGNAPAIREVIRDGEDGYVVPQEPGELAEKILLLLGQPTVRDEMGQRGREKVLAKYTWESLARKTELIYTQLLG